MTPVFWSRLRRWAAPLVLPAVTCCAVAGCTNFTIDHRQKVAKPALPPIVKPKDALTLEVQYIELGADNPLIGEALWRELDEAGAFKSPDARARIRSAGLRVGMAGSNAPQTLRAASAEHRSGSAAGVQKITLLAGQETTFQAAHINQPFELRTHGAGGERITPYSNARCVLRLSAERQQDGWVRLRVQPELHHGPSSIVPRATDGSWKLEQGQKIDSLYEQKFDVELNVGELVVVGPHGPANDTIGGRFFRSGQPPAASERILVIRIADIQQIEPVRSNNW